MPTDLHGWHRGERSIHTKLDLTKAVEKDYNLIQGIMPDQHRRFHAENLPFVPIATLDADGRPWTSIAAGASGERGFIQSPTETQLIMNVKMLEGDPLIDNLALFGNGKKLLIAGIGIDFSNRRRNKFAGHVKEVQYDDPRNVRLNVVVNQAIGNCPKYINIRDLYAHPNTSPRVAYKVLQLSEEDRLPEDVIEFIHDSDTVFIGTTYQAKPEDEARFPSHVGQNQRGANRGFTRVRPSDGRTVVMPDYSGNRLMTSLGNIEATPLASLSFISFPAGDVLYLTGHAKNLIGQEAQALMPFQNVLTAVYVTGYVLIRDALPVRQRPGSEVERSLYSPPIKLLKEEVREGAQTLFDDEVSVTLTSMEMHSPDLATFVWETSKEITIEPGQTAILDFTSMIGAQGYNHMASWKPSAVNDDRIRTWTISSAHIGSDGKHTTKQFAMTMREKPGGAVTGALFDVLRGVDQIRPDMVVDARAAKVRVRLVGIAGEFTLPPALFRNNFESLDEATSFLWIAGGIGLTPFISMIAALGSLKRSIKEPNIDLLIATREPDVLLSLIYRALATAGEQSIRLTLHIFSSQAPSPLPDNIPPRHTVALRHYNGRIPETFFQNIDGIKARKVYLCGPLPFENAVMAGLAKAGIYKQGVTREGFLY